MNGGLFAISQRLPPTNPQAEQALLGAVMANPKALHAVVEFLRPEHFAEPAHGRLYKEATRRILAGGVADPISLRSWWQGDPEAATLGGFDFLARLLGAMVGIINAREYGFAVFECWQRRELIAVGEEIVNRSFAATSADTPAGLVTGMIGKLDAVVAGVGDVQGAVSMDGAMDAALTAAERAHQRQGPAGISTGMRSVDEALGGLEPQTVTVLAGRPGMGKSALGWGWAVHAAREAKAAHGRGEEKQGVLMLSLEMSAEQLGRRSLSAVSGVPLEAIKRGRLGQEQFDRLVLARRELGELPLLIEDSGGMNVGVIRLKARAAKRRHGLGLIVVDHLHLIRPEEADARNGGTWAVGKVSNALKAMAKEFNCPVLALAQLNRGVEGREEKRPTLADLRQAGELEQDADNVAFIYRGEYYLPKGEPEQKPGEMQGKFAERCADLDEARQRLKGRAELIFEKVRDGSPCSVPLLFDGDRTLFSEPSW